jgi:hypothetical protein
VLVLEPRGSIQFITLTLHTVHKHSTCKIYLYLLTFLLDNMLIGILKHQKWLFTFCLHVPAIIRFVEGEAIRAGRKNAPDPELCNYRLGWNWSVKEIGPLKQA